LYSLTQVDEKIKQRGQPGQSAEFGKNLQKSVLLITAVRVGVSERVCVKIWTELN